MDITLSPKPYMGSSEDDRSFLDPQSSTATSGKRARKGTVNLERYPERDRFEP